MKIKAVIFDLGRVLVNVDFTRGLFPYLDGQQGKDDQTILKEVFNNPLFRAYSTGKIDTVHLYNELKTMFKLDLSFAKFREVWCDVFAPMEGMEDIVNRVASTCPTGILSDTDPLHWAFVLEQYPFLQTIKNRTLSFEIGALKPAAVTFRTAAKAVGEAPENCLFIDDRDINVEGAKRTGMQAFQFINPEQMAEELTARGVL